MGDRTYAYYKIHPEDIARACELPLCNVEPKEDYENFDPDGCRDDGLRHIEEVNYGGGMDWEDMAEAGIRFYGWHGAGGEYGPTDFYSDGEGQVVNADAGHDGGYVLYEMKDGGFDPVELRRLEAYLRRYHATVKQIDEAWSLLPCNMAAEVNNLWRDYDNV